MASFFPLAVVVASGVLYHLCQKSLGRIGSPWGLLVVAYGVALAVCLVLWLVNGASWASTASRRALFGSIGVGIAIVGIEAGFLLTYKMGWQLSVASVIANTSVGVLLALIGMAIAGEPVTLGKSIGLVLAILGVILMARG